MFRAAVVALALAGCGGGLPSATASDAARVHVQLADLERGRSLVLGKCSGCHRPPLPIDVLPDAWPAKVGEMAARSHIDRDERALIETYFVTLATRG